MRKEDRQQCIGGRDVIYVLVHNDMAALKVKDKALVAKVSCANSSESSFKLPSSGRSAVGGN